MKREDQPVIQCKQPIKIEKPCLCRSFIANTTKTTFLIFSSARGKKSTKVSEASDVNIPEVAP